MTPCHVTMYMHTIPSPSIKTFGERRVLRYLPPPLSFSRKPRIFIHFLVWYTTLRRRVRESNPGHIGGRRALSPLRQPCSLLTTENVYDKISSEFHLMGPAKLRVDSFTNVTQLAKSVKLSHIIDTSLVNCSQLFLGLTHMWHFKIIFVTQKCTLTNKRKSLPDNKQQSV